MSDIADGEIEGFLRSHGPFESPPLLENGDSVGEWTVRAFLGRGGSAEVYRAENNTTGIVAALKVLCRADERTRERFRREAKLVAGIGNAAFPKFYGAGCAAGRFYIAEELLEPMPLPKTDAEVARFVLAVANGAEELHRRGIVHRDIKPRNVMMRPSTGESVLIDMGLAKEGEDLSQIGNDTVSVADGRAVGVGTPGFSAPEQFAGGKIGPATDIHALGMLANVCFDGKPPRAWAKIIRRSTSTIPEQRYATVAEFARAVRHRHARRWLWAIIAIILLCFAFFSHRFWGLSPEEVHEDHGIGREELVNSIIEAACDNDGIGGVPDANTITNGVVKAENLFSIGETKREGYVLVTRILLNGKDISIPGEVRLVGSRRIEIVGPGRLTASITGPREARLELSDQATLINLTTTPYPASRMKYVLCGACYLNFKNLDGPEDGDVKNIWVDDFDGKGVPSFRFRGPDSYKEVREADRKAAVDAIRKGTFR